MCDRLSSKLLHVVRSISNPLHTPISMHATHCEVDRRLPLFSVIFFIGFNDFPSISCTKIACSSHSSNFVPFLKCYICNDSFYNLNFLAVAILIGIKAGPVWFKKKKKAGPVFSSQIQHFFLHGIEFFLKQYMA